MLKFFCLLSMALAGAFGPATFAAEMLHVGELSIHANAFVASALAPQVAERVGIKRDAHRGVLNVTLVRGKPGTAGSSAIALVETRIVEPEYMRGAVAMREVRDGEGVSYIGEFALPEPATVELEIRIRPAASTETQTIRMTQELFD